MIPVSAPVRVRDRLRAAPDGPVPVLHRGPRAVYVEVGGAVVGVVDGGAVRVPCALRTRCGEVAALAHGEARLERGLLHLAGAPLVVGRLDDVAVPRLDPRRLGPPVPRSPSLRPAAVAALVGAGDGLTPYGDDVLCGWLALHRAAGVATPAVDAAVRAHLSRTTPLSATLLECALLGEAIPQVADLVTALGTREEPRAAAALAAVGHTSGAGLLQGARWALDDLGVVVGAAA